MAVAAANPATHGGSADPRHNLQASRQAYYDKISKYDMTPLWEVLKNLVTKEQPIPSWAHGRKCQSP